MSNKEIRSHLEISEKKCSDLQSLNEKLQSQVALSDQISSENSNLQAKISELEGELQNYKTQGGKLKKFLKGLQQENERLNSLVSDKETEIAEKDEKIKELSETGFKNENEKTSLFS